MSLCNFLPSIRDRVIFYPPFIWGLVFSFSIYEDLYSYTLHISLCLVFSYHQYEPEFSTTLCKSPCITLPFHMIICITLTSLWVCVFPQTFQMKPCIFYPLFEAAYSPTLHMRQCIFLPFIWGCVFSYPLYKVLYSLILHMRPCIILHSIWAYVFSLRPYEVVSSLKPFKWGRVFYPPIEAVFFLPSIWSRVFSYSHGQRR